MNTARRLLGLGLAVAVIALAGGNYLARAADVNNHLTLDQSPVRVVGSISTICAHADRTFINVNNLRWTAHSRLAKVKYVSGMPANCRQYRAPKVVGWDRVRVTYVYHGEKFVANALFHIVARP